MNGRKFYARPADFYLFIAQKKSKIHSKNRLKSIKVDFNLIVGH